MGVSETLAKRGKRVTNLFVFIFVGLLCLLQVGYSQTYKEDLFPIWQSQIRTIEEQEAVLNARNSVHLLDNVRITAPTVGGSSLANPSINISLKKVTVPNIISKAINLPISWELDFVGSWYQIKAYGEHTTHAGKSQKPALQLSLPIPADVQEDEFLAVLVHYPRSILGNGALFMIDQGQRKNNSYTFAASGIYEQPFSFSLVRFKDIERNVLKTVRQGVSFTSSSPTAEIAFTTYCSIDSVLLNSCNPSQLEVASTAALKRYSAYKGVGFAEPVMAQDSAFLNRYGQVINYKLMLSHQEAHGFTFRPCRANTGAFLLI